MRMRQQLGTPKKWDSSSPAKNVNIDCFHESPTPYGSWANSMSILETLSYIHTYIEHLLGAISYRSRRHKKQKQLLIMVHKVCSWMSFIFVCVVLTINEIATSAIYFVEVRNHAHAHLMPGYRPLRVSPRHTRLVQPPTTPTTALENYLAGVTAYRTSTFEHT